MKPVPAKTGAAAVAVVGTVVAAAVAVAVAVDMAAAAEVAVAGTAAAAAATAVAATATKPIHNPRSTHNPRSGGGCFCALPGTQVVRFLMWHSGPPLSSTEGRRSAPTDERPSACGGTQPRAAVPHCLSSPPVTGEPLRAPSPSDPHPVV